MPSIGEVTKARVRLHCEHLESVLKPPVLTDEERAALHASDVPEDERTKDDWWKRLGEVRSYARRKEFDQWTPGGEVEEEALLEVQNLEPVAVELPRGTEVRVHPASWDRVMAVEDLDFWLKQLMVWRHLVKENREDFDEPDYLLGRLRMEVERTRRWLYAQVTEPGQKARERRQVPSWLVRTLDRIPLVGGLVHDLLEGLPLWTRWMTGIEEIMLLHAWLEVNVSRPKKAEQVIRQKYPTKKGGGQGDKPSTLQGFAFTMTSVAYRERKAPREIICDRSMAEVLTTYTNESQRKRHEHEEAEAKAEARKNKAKLVI